MRTQAIDRPDFDAPNEGALRTQTFAWLLRDVVPQGRTMLDLGAGPCVFAKRGHDAGYLVTAVDGRTDRVPGLPEDWAGEHWGGEWFTFVYEDVRTYPAGHYDVVTILGLLYHLEPRDQFELLAKHRVNGTVILDTQVHIPEAITDAAKGWGEEIVQAGDYEGVVFPEGDNPMASIGNPTSLWQTEPSLLRMVKNAGYTSCTIVDPYYVSKYGARKFYVLSAD